MEKKFSFFIILLALYESITYLSVDMYLPAVPQMQSMLGLSMPEAQLTLTLWFLGSTSLQLFLGPIADKYGRRPVLLGGGIIFILSTLVCTWTNSFPLLLLCRFLQGCTVCSVIVAGYATIHELYDHKAAIKALALLGTLTLLAPALGPVIGGVIVSYTNWRNIFLLLCISGLGAILFLNKKMPETLKEPHPITFSKVIKNYWDISTIPSFYMPTLVVCTFFCGFIAWVSAGPMLLIEQYGISPINFGYCQLLVFGSFIGGTRIVRLLIDKTASSNLVVAGLTLTIIGGTAFFLCSALNSSVPPLIMAMMVFAVGDGMAYSILQRIAIDSIPSYPMGAKMAVYSFATSLFGVIGSALITVMPLAVVLGICAAVGFVLTLLQKGFAHEKANSI